MKLHISIRLLHVSQINHHPQGDINTKKQIIPTQFLHVQC